MEAEQRVSSSQRSKTTKRSTSSQAATKLEERVSAPFQAETLDKNTSLFTFYDVNGQNSIQILYLVPQEGKLPFFGFSPALVDRLNTLNDITYSQDKPALFQEANKFSFFRQFECVPIELSNIMQPYDSDGSISKVGSELLIFLQKHYTKPSLPFRCPRLIDFKSALLLLFVSFVIKSYFSFSFTHHLQQYNAMFVEGDGQFHRHWQQIAINVPIHEWYVPSAINHDFYCFLNYPIFAQYLHLFMAKFITQPLVPQALRLSNLWIHFDPFGGMMHMIDPDAVDEYIDANGVRKYPFQTSRYYYSSRYAFVQRVTYLVLDTVLLGGASLALGSYLWRKINPRLRFTATLILLITPLGILIDHGNPQVNYLSFALFFLALRYALSNHFALSASLAMLSANSKAAALSVMPPFAVLVLARLAGNKYFPGHTAKQKLIYLVKIGASALGTFFFIHLPLLGKTSLGRVKQFVFPFAYRQLTQQPVINVIRFLNQYFIKLERIEPLTPQGLRNYYLSNIATLLVSVPSWIILAKNPTNRRFIKAIQLTALGFFQVGYCVHEKTIMWYVYPLALSIFDDSGHLYLSSTLLSLFGAFCLVVESRNWIIFFKLVAFQFVIFLFYSKFPKTCNLATSADQAGFLSFLSRGVNKYLHVIIIVLSAYLFIAQGDTYDLAIRDFSQGDRVGTYILFTFLPIWCYLQKSLMEKEERFEPLVELTYDPKVKPE